MASKNGANPEVAITRERIGPGEASALLPRFVNNRHSRYRKVSAFARDMKEGKWAVTGDTLKFGADGQGLDGEHRLLAVVEANTEVDFFVAWNVSAESQAVMDTGTTRKFSDVLHMRGEGNAVQVAAAIRWVWTYERGGLRDAKKVATNHELLAWYAENPGIRDSFVFTNRLRSRLKVAISPMAGIHYLVSLDDPADADAFFQMLMTGENLSPGDPIFALRRWMEQSRVKTETVPIMRLSAYTIKAMNYWREGKQIHNLRWAAGGASAEPFPKLLSFSE